MPLMGQVVSKNGPQSIGHSRGGVTTKLHLLVLDEERWAWSFSLTYTHIHRTQAIHYEK